MVGKSSTVLVKHFRHHDHMKNDDAFSYCWYKPQSGGVRNSGHHDLSNIHMNRRYHKQA